MQSLTILCFAAVTTAQRGYNPPTVEKCPSYENASNVACVRNYAAVLPYPFERTKTVNGDPAENDTFVDTSVPSDPSFGQLQNASFVVFDQSRGLDILGSHPRVERIFEAPPADSIHEAPVYVPELNAIIYSLPHQGIYQQQIVNLNSTPPTLSNFTTTPPVYAVNGGKYYKGKIYWAVEASFPFPDPSNASQIVHQAPGISMLDPITREVETLLNNYYGQLLNSPNDLFIDSVGDIWFTDSWYGYAINVTDYPVLAPNTYRFRPSTGAVSIVENTLDQPNGIGISPDGKTMYITDTGFTDFDNAPVDVLPRYTVNPLGGRTVNAYDVNFSPAGNYLTGKRPIWYAETFGDDGFHVSREGYLLGAAGAGVDVLSEYGELIMRIEVEGTVNNLQFAGTKRNELWLFGMGGIFKVSGLGQIHGMIDE